MDLASAERGGAPPPAGALSGARASGRACLRLPSAKIAGLLLALRPHLCHIGMQPPRAADIIALMGTRKSRAYAERTRILHVLTAEQRHARPDLEALSRRVLRFVFDHPGAVHSHGHRRSYSDEFRRLLIDLREEHRGVSLVAFSRAVEVPLPTLREWLSAARVLDDPERAGRRQPATTAAGDGRQQGQADEEACRQGAGCAACSATVGDASTAAHARQARSGRRGRRWRLPRSHDSALRGSFTTFFPGAQWVSDGTSLPVEIDGERWDFNLQLVVDTHTGALVGASVRDHEDSRAVIESFADAVQTTGAPPLALLLDNRPCNRSARIADALGDATGLMYATKGRPQNKAHVEGAFGLFALQVPPIRLECGDPRQLARQVLELVVTTWARTLNQRPRRDRGGRSRVQLYHSEQPDAEKRCATREMAREYLQRRRARAQSARKERCLQRMLAAQAFLELDLGEPEGRLAWAVARYPLDAIVAGRATYEAKQAAKTLPEFSDRENRARYFHAIVRNIAEEEEGLHVAERLLLRRREAHACVLRRLEARRATFAPESAPEALIPAVIDEMMTATSRVEQHFWSEAVMQAIRRAAGLRPDAQDEFYRHAARRILATRRAPYRERLAAVRTLAATLVPLS
jgi:hypothetical protein